MLPKASEPELLQLPVVPPEFEHAWRSGGMTRRSVCASNLASRQGCAAAAAIMSLTITARASHSGSFKHRTRNAAPNWRVSRSESPVQAQTLDARTEPPRRWLRICHPRSRTRAGHEAQPIHQIAHRRSPLLFCHSRSDLPSRRRSNPRVPTTRQLPPGLPPSAAELVTENPSISQPTGVPLRRTARSDPTFTSPSRSPTGRRQPLSIAPAVAAQHRDRRRAHRRSSFMIQPTGVLVAILINQISFCHPLAAGRRVPTRRQAAPGLARQPPPVSDDPLRPSISHDHRDAARRPELPDQVTALPSPFMSAASTQLPAGDRDCCR